MAGIEHDLLPKQKTRKQSMRVKIDLYAYATEFYAELDRMGIIDRMRNVPQLGVVRVPKRLCKSRFDYAMLQLYFHQLIKRELQQELKLTYNNPVGAEEFNSSSVPFTKNDRPSIGDILQIITIAYNAGHFYNTFTASRAVTMLATEDLEFKNYILRSSQNNRFEQVANSIFDEQNYMRLHLINSLIIIDKCDQSKRSVLLAKEILYNYLGERELPENSKLHYAFTIFRRVRDVSYVAYDLQIANTPFTIDLWNEKAILVLFQELLSNFNDRAPANNLMKSIEKLLDDTVYNENSNAICYYRISRLMASSISKNINYSNSDYYDYLFLREDGYLNKPYRQSRDYIEKYILKLTFSHEENQMAYNLLFDLEHTNNTRVGYYDRSTGEKTVLVSIKSHSKSKATTAFRIMKCVISYLRTDLRIDACDVRYLLAAKFFLYYFFGEKPTIIEPTIDPSKCVLCVRGKKRRIAEIDKLLSQGSGNTDQRHEVEFLKKKLSEDIKNDTCLLIPGSIVVYENKSSGKKLCEFDGMIVFPYRETNQLLLLEAKNTCDNPSLGKKCLCKKLDKLKIAFERANVTIDGHDAFLEKTV